MRRYEGELTMQDALVTGKISLLELYLTAPVYAAHEKYAYMKRMVECGVEPNRLIDLSFLIFFEQHSFFE